MFPDLPQQIQLSHSGQTAELTRDILTDRGVVLSIGTEATGMAEQSHVEVGDPEFLLHDYLRRMRAVLTARFQNDQASPATVLHLGAGALTLPRWVGSWRPEAQQTVVDIEPELVGFVLEYLPMQPAPQSVVADAAEVLSTGGALAGRQFDVIVVDLFNSAEAPATLISPEFSSRVLQALSEGGIMLMNFGDEAGMGFARQLTDTVLQVSGHGAHALLSAPADVLTAQAEGNLVLAVTAQGFSEAQLGQIWAAGPHPGDVLTGQELAEWCS